MKKPLFQPESRGRSTSWISVCMRCLSFAGLCPQSRIRFLSQVKYAPTGVDEQASYFVRKTRRRRWLPSFCLYMPNSQNEERSLLIRLTSNCRVSARRGSYHHLYGRRSQRSGIRRFYRPGAGIRSGRYGSGCRRRGKPDASRLYDRCDGYDDLDPERLGDEIS